MRVIHPLDRDWAPSSECAAIKDWIDGYPDRDKEVLRSLASLKRREAWVWSPEIGFGPQCIQFPLFATYDSFAVPSGESAAKLKGWAAVDLEEVKAKLAIVVEEAEANDPGKLKAEIARLRREIAQRDAAGRAKPDPQALTEADWQGISRGFRRCGEFRCCAQRASRRATRSLRMI